MDETTDNLIIKKQIMRRVYLIYWLRRLGYPTTLYKAAGLFGLVGLNLVVISVPDVLLNINNIHSWPAIWRYLLNSFVNSELSAKTAVLSGFVALALIFKDAFSRLWGRLHFPLFHLNGSL